MITYLIGIQATEGDPNVRIAPKRPCGVGIAESGVALLSAIISNCAANEKGQEQVYNHGGREKPGGWECLLEVLVDDWHLGEEGLRKGERDCRKLRRGLYEIQSI